MKEYEKGPEEKIFDMITSIRNENDYKVVSSKGEALKEGHITPRQQIATYQKFLNGFVHNAVSDTVVNSNLSGTHTAKIRAFSGSSDLPELTKDVFTTTAQTPNYDMGWSEAFRTVPLMQGQLSWEIATTKSGEGFMLVKEGEPVKVYSLSGEKVTASIAKYGSAIGVTWEMIEGRKLYQFVQALETMRANLYKLWADTHYGLLATAAASNTQAYVGKGDNTKTQIVKDIDTLNAAYIKIGNDTKDSGYGDVSSVVMRLYAHPKLSPRINSALRLSSSDIVQGTGTGSRVEFPIQFTPTFTSKIPNDKAILVLPGNRIQNAIYMRELGLQKQDNMTLSDIQTYWTAFGGHVADGKQVVEVSFS